MADTLASITGLALSDATALLARFGGDVNEAASAHFDGRPSDSGSGATRASPNSSSSRRGREGAFSDDSDDDSGRAWGARLPQQQGGSAAATTGADGEDGAAQQPLPADASMEDKLFAKAKKMRPEDRPSGVGSRGGSSPQRFVPFGGQ